MTQNDPTYGRLDKTEGSFYTPAAIAEAILDIAGYRGDDIADSYVIDPACGDGALLVPITCRLIEALLNKGFGASQVPEKLYDHIHAYELDAAELEKAKAHVVEAARSYEIDLDQDRLVNFRCGDAFDLYEKDTESFDYVVGNPPYVRIHNLEEKPESKYIEGMCDLYYGFFDIGQHLLKPGGVLCFIAPSSWFAAKAGHLMRSDLSARRVVSAVLDFGHYQVFAPYATTYTAIVRIGTEKADKIKIYSYDDGAALTSEVDQDRAWVNGLFMPGSSEWMTEVLSATGDVRVLNGYATNLDRVFISKSARFDGSPYERECIKASRCEKNYMVYPYDGDGHLIPFEDMKKVSADVAALLEDNKDALCNRTQVDGTRWWCFARSQGIADTFHDKVAVQSLVKPGEPVRVVSAPAGTGVYGGVYVLGLDEDIVRRAVNSDEFFQYAAALRKYKSGGYYAVGGKDLERFLNWWQKRNNKEN